MKRVFVALVLAAAASCSLNPQPFPPDNPDAALAASDAGKGADSSTFGEAGAIPDAASEAAPIPDMDSGSDAADASDDVTTDAPIDAPSDALNDVATD
jgi:hypothetical protein